MASRALRVLESLLLVLVVTSSCSGCSVSELEATAALGDGGLLVVYPPRVAGRDPHAPTYAGFEVLDAMGQVVRWLSGAWGGRVSVPLRSGFYEVRARGCRTLVDVRAGEVTRIDLRGAGGDPRAGAPARSSAARGGP
jgi:hypothetical protein